VTIRPRFLPAQTAHTCFRFTSRVSSAVQTISSPELRVHQLQTEVQKPVISILPPTVHKVNL
jgi:hypothetical protein